MKEHILNTKKVGTTHELPPVPIDPKLAFAHLLDTRKVLALLADGGVVDVSKIANWRVEHIRYRPGQSCTILFKVEHESGAGSRTTSLYAKCLTEDEFESAAKLAAGRRWVAGALLDEPLIMSDCRTIMYEFPNDARLRAIRAIANPNRLARDVGELLSRANDGRETVAGKPATLSPLRYKPESRLVVRYESYWTDSATGEETTTPIVLRFDRRSRSEDTIGVTQRLSRALASELSIAVPKLLFHTTPGGFVGFEWIDGEKLSDLLKMPECHSALAKTARALAVLHTCADQRLPVRSPTDHFGQARVKSHPLRGCSDEITKRVDEVLRNLTAAVKRTAIGRTGFVHGDFHQGQVLLSGDRTYVVDLDRAYTGETVADVGNFVAQIELLGLRGRLQGASDVAAHFVEEYERATGLQLNGNRLKYWIGVSLLELATKEFRRLKNDWPARVTAILDCCLAKSSR